MRTTFMTAVVLVAALCVAPGVKGKQASPTAGLSPPPLTQAQLRQLPRTPADFSARLETVKTRLKELRAGQEGPPPAPEDMEAVERRKQLEARIEAWNEYQDVLQRAASFAEEIARLTGSKAIAESAEEVSGVEAEAASLEKQGPPRSVSDEELQSSEERLRDVEARVGELSDLQSQRQARLDSGLESRRKELEADETQLQQPAAPPEQPAPKNPSPPPTEGEAGTTEKPPPPQESEEPRASPVVPPPAPDEGGLTPASIRIAAMECSIQALALERQLIEMQSSRDKPLLEALRRLKTALGDRHAALVKARSRNTVANLESQRGSQSEPAEAALVDLKLFHERVLQTYWRNPPDLADLQERLRRLDQSGTRTREDWEDEKGLSGFYTGEELAALYNRVQEDVAEYERLLDKSGRLEAEALADLRDLRAVRARTLQRFDELQQALAARLPALPAKHRAEIETEVATLRSDLTAAIKEGIHREEQVVDEARKKVEALSGDVAALRTVEQQLYWKRLAFRDSGLMGTDWGAVWRALSATAGGGFGNRAAAEEGKSSSVEVELFGRNSGERARLRSLVDDARGELGGLGPAAWGLAAGWALLALLAGLVLVRVARRKSVPLADAIRRRFLEKQEGEDGALTIREGLSARIDLLALNMFGDLIVPLLLGAVLIGLSYRWLHDPVVRRLIVLPILLLVVTILLLRLVHHLFEPDSPPHRVLLCDDSVARYYRRWLDGMLIYSAVLLFLPFELWVAGLALPLQNGLLEIYKTGLLVLLLLFLFRKRLVLGLGLDENARRRWGRSLTSALYPLIVLVAMALLFLEVIGYGLLVTHVGRGLALTAAMVVLVVAAAEYLIDLLRRESVAVTGGGAAPADPPAEQAEGDEPERPAYIVGLVTNLTRLFAIALSLFLIIRIWRIPLPEDALNWRTYALGGLVLVIGLVIDRVLAASFDALSGSGRLPASTSILIQRWLRSVLAVLVVLTLVALLGWKIHSIWTLLTTVLAMIAVGFFAVWSMLSNILATLVILIWRPFNVGELVEITPDGIKGQVVDINFIFTTLKAEDGRKVTVPNNLFAQHAVSRQITRGRPKRTLAEQLERDRPLGE
jgi:hypothetical protein